MTNKFAKLRVEKEETRYDFIKTFCFMNADRIAKNARIIWDMLTKAAAPMTFIDMIVQSHLQANDLAFAIGWLAREDRISIIEEGDRQFFKAY